MRERGEAEPAKDVCRHSVRVERSGFDVQRGGAIVRQAFSVTFTCGSQIGEQGAFWGAGFGLLILNAPHESFKRRIEKHEGCTRGRSDGGAVDRRFERAASEGDDHISCTQNADQRVGLYRAKMRLTVVGEELCDGLALPALDMPIKIQEAPAELLGEQDADGGFARAHEAAEENALRG